MAAEARARESILVSEQAMAAATGSAAGSGSGDGNRGGRPETILGDPFRGSLYMPGRANERPMRLVDLCKIFCCSRVSLQRHRSL